MKEEDQKGLGVECSRAGQVFFCLFGIRPYTTVYNTSAPVHLPRAALPLV